LVRFGIANAPSIGAGVARRVTGVGDWDRWGL
jgi:hypothetical protein